VSTDKQHFVFFDIFFLHATSCCVTWLPKISEPVVACN